MGLIVLIIFICCGYYAQTRGKVRHESLSRMITDHSNLFSPINCLNYGFSRVDNTPYLSPKEFPDLQIFEDNWEIIKEEAMSLYDNSQITASAKLNDVGFNSFFNLSTLLGSLRDWIRLIVRSGNSSASPRSIDWARCAWVLIKPGMTIWPFSETVVVQLRR